MKTILIVDDDVYIGDMLEEFLTKENYAVGRAYSGTEALLYLASRRPDLILLDLMLPGLSGEELLPLIKDIPVIIVSAKAEVSDKVDLLLGGAADYITKPFDTSELLARITVQLRKNTGRKSSGILSFDAIRMNTDTRAVTVADAPVRLTQTEYAILKLLMANPSQVITKSVILDRISEEEDRVTGILHLEIRLITDSWLRRTPLSVEVELVRSGLEWKLTDSPLPEFD